MMLYPLQDRSVVAFKALTRTSVRSLPSVENELLHIGRRYMSYANCPLCRDADVTRFWGIATLFLVSLRIASTENG